MKKLYSAKRPPHPDTGFKNAKRYFKKRGRKRVRKMLKNMLREEVVQNNINS